MARRGRRKKDMQVSDAEMEVVDEDPVEDPEIVVDDEEEDMLSESKEDELEDEEQPEEEEEEDEEEDEEEEPSSSPAPEASGPSIPPRLRIKLRLPAHASGASSVQSATGASTPTGLIRRRRIPSEDVDIESEDSDEEDRSTRSTSVATATPGRPLTARQAVLRNVVDASHVSLSEPPNPRKKKPLTEIELALKREETARKRRNLSEKKLEDEKAETINRLLKRQSRSKGKRNVLSTAEDRQTPASNNGADVDMDEGEEAVAPAIPTMYRWISTSKAVAGADGVQDSQKTTRLLFSVPAAVVAQSRAAENVQETPQSALPLPKPRCDVEGCGDRRKYRLVKDWQRGACGMPHLKVLEAQVASMTR